LEQFIYSKVIGNYEVIKLLKSSWRPFCLPVDSYPFTYSTGTVYLL